MNKYNAQIGAGGTQYAYYHEEDESSFQLVSLKQLLIDIIRAYLHPFFHKHEIEKPKFLNMNRLTLHDRYVQCTEEEDFSEEVHEVDAV